MMDIIVGQDKEPFGLEELTSSKNLSFIERSMVSSAFTPGRNIGISLNGERYPDYGRRVSIRPRNP